ncbi:ABC transporter permease [Frigidibacter sp. MR17.24]|uniref:ABC transporter permease n=1 Tax=Frigidibacter sp. MR17.24 TaxID=3127345 RepID=UPI003012F370
MTAIDTTLSATDAAALAEALPPRPPRFATTRRVLGSPKGVIGLLLMLGIAAMAALAPILFPLGPWAMVGRPYIWPGAGTTLMGTDVLGRDMTAAMFWGAQISLLVGLVSAAVSLVLGIAVGSVAGYFGGGTDAVLMRLTDAVQTVPAFLFTIVIVAVVSPSITSIVLAISLVSWPAVARLMRAEVLSVRKREFVQSCKVIGMSDARIILTQVIPNSLSPVIVIASVLVASAIITEAGLAFLGLGDPNVMSWGTMINLGRPSIRTTWYIALIPGGFVILTVLALNLLGDAINDAFNPHLRKR